VTFGSHVTAFAALVSLVGCVVGPNYKHPSLPAGASSPLLSIGPAVEVSAEVPEEWWRLYNDPILDRLLEESFAANADLAVAEANLLSARAVLDAARYGRYPSTTIDAGGIYGRNATFDEVLEIGGHSPKRTWILDDVLDVSYELDLFGHVRRSIEASRADTQAAAAGRDALKVTIAAETARAYAQICTLGEELAVAHRSLDVVTNEALITAQRHEAGANSRFDVVRAQGLVAQVRSTIPPSEGQRRAALFQLTALLGRTPVNAPTDTLACVIAPRLTELIPVGDGASLIKRRPDIRQAERHLAGATARIGITTADLYPRITLSALYGGAAANIPSLVTEPGLTWGVGPSISWAFPNQSIPRARVRQANAGAAAALAEFDSVALGALKETEQSLALYGAELDRRQALGEARDKAHEAFDLAHDQFIAGSLSNLELLVTEQVLVAADAAVATSDAALAQAQISIFKALGGGWQRPSRGILRSGR
jgi:NodT family efflux transporter outer membrane factor (OMF) lipoprotein